MTEEKIGKTSRISGFHRLIPKNESTASSSLPTWGRPSARNSRRTSNIDPQLANHMIENYVTTIAIPVGIATNLRIDGRDVLVPWRPRNHP